MTHTIELVKDAAVVSDTNTDQRQQLGRVVDRRRPGRMRDVSPELLPLLRSPTAPVTEPLPETETPSAVEVADRIEESSFVEDDLGAAKAIMFASIMAMPFWSLAAFGLWKLID